MENGRPPRCGKCFARHDGKLGWLGEKSVDILDDSELSRRSGGDETCQVSEHPPLRFLE